MTTKIKMIVLAIALMLSATMSACGSVSKVVNSCGDITTCAHDTPNAFSDEFAADLNNANNALFNK